MAGAGAVLGRKTDGPLNVAWLHRAEVGWAGAVWVWPPAVLNAALLLLLGAELVQGRLLPTRCGHGEWGEVRAVLFWSSESFKRARSPEDAGIVALHHFRVGGGRLNSLKPRIHCMSPNHLLSLPSFNK